MLQSLSIRNFAIIERLNLEFGPGFNVLTGETGAGKSIIIGALNLVLGGRAGAELVRGGAERALVDAVFDLSKAPEIADLARGIGVELEQDRLLISREVSASGKSSARIGGRPAAVSQLKDLGDRLVDLHGQHEHQSLLAVSRHVDLLDDWAGRPVAVLRAEAAATYASLSALKQERARLESDARERTHLLDLYEFQVKEIRQAALQPGEDEALALEHRRMANAQRLVEAAAG